MFAESHQSSLYHLVTSLAIESLKALNLLLGFHKKSTSGVKWVIAAQMCVVSRPRNRMASERSKNWIEA